MIIEVDVSICQTLRRNRRSNVIRGDARKQNSIAHINSFAEVEVTGQRLHEAGGCGARTGTLQRGTGDRCCTKQ